MVSGVAIRTIVFWGVCINNMDYSSSGSILVIRTLGFGGLCYGRVVFAVLLCRCGEVPAHGRIREWVWNGQILCSSNATS